MTAGELIAWRWRDVRAALATPPDGRAWSRCALVYVGFLLCAAPLGLATGLLRPGLQPLRPLELALSIVIVFVHPALVEEILFRAVLLPREAATVRRGRLVAAGAVALALYVASHPLNAILLRPGAVGIFENPVYLTLAALLGLACTAAYWISRSIWPSVVMHWITVVVWLWFLGGHALLC